MKFIKYAAMILLCVIVIGSVTAHATDKNNISDIWSFDRAMIKLPTGYVSGTIEDWQYFENCGMAWVEYDDGSVYFTHITNIVLIKSGEAMGI